MPGPGIEDDIYSSYTARPRLPDLDDGDVDSPVLGLWADVEEKRVLSRKSGECLCSTRMMVPVPVMGLAR